MAPHIKVPPTLLWLAVILWLSACSGSNSTPQSTTSSPPQTGQEPTKPPPTTQPPSSAPPGTQPPGSTPPSSGGAFNQGTGFNAFVRTILMTQDGSNDLYVGGDFTTYNGTPANHVIRLRPNGSVAQTFGQGFDEVVLALGLATDSSNALFASGTFTQFNGQPVPQVIRITPTGLRDSSFQPSGLDFVPEMLAVPEDASRNVYVGGNVSTSPPLIGNSSKVVRLSPNGTPDATSTFFIGGDPTVSPVVTMAVPPGSGKLYVGGSIGTLNGEAVTSFLRLNPDGTLDTSFVQGTEPASSPVAVIVEAIAPARDGSDDVYAGGRIARYNGTPVNGSIRVHGNGALDTSYVQAAPLIPMGIWPAQDGTGDIFVSGFSTIDGTVFRLMRLDRGGALVSTFREPTLHIEPNTPFWLLSIVPALDGTRDLYIGGTFTTYNGVPVNHIARIHADGSLASVVN